MASFTPTNLTLQSLKGSSINWKNMIFHLSLIPLGNGLFDHPYIGFYAIT
jgi:hypothetical protein